MSEQIRTYSKLKMQEGGFKNEKVNIIIPFYGSYGRVTRLIKNIIKITQSNPYQIVLVDDGSPNKNYVNIFKESSYTKQEGNYAPVMIVVQNKKQLGFGGAIQAGLAASQQPWVVIMHTDVQIDDPNWLLKMGNDMLSNDEVQMVAARSNNPGDNQDFFSETNSEAKMKYTTGTLPLYCAMTHRNLFDGIGNIKSYPYGYYEDEEFSFRMRAYDVKYAVSSAWVKHEGGGTFNELWKNVPSKAESILEGNRMRCISDMKSLIRK